MALAQQTLRTSRLELRPLGPEHQELTRQLDFDPDVMKYVLFGRPLTPEESNETHKWLLNAATIVPGLGCWAGYVRDGFVGWWVLAPSQSNAGEEEPPQYKKERAEFGWRLLPKFWRKGYAKEGSIELLRHAFQDLGLMEVGGDTMSVNAGSQATMASSGMRKVRTYHTNIRSRDYVDHEVSTDAVSFTVMRDVCGANRTLEPHIQLSWSLQPSIFIRELLLHTTCIFFYIYLRPMAIQDESHSTMDVNTPNDTKQISAIEEKRTLADPTDEKIATPRSMEQASESEVQKDEKPSEDAQNGVRKMEAVTLAWSKKSLAAVLILIWLVTLVNNFKATIVGSLTPFATSDWKSHSLLTVIDIVASAMTAAVYIPMAKLLDVWGRAEGFLLMLCLCTLGLILMAASKNLPTYCAAQVFYSVGFGGLSYSWNVIATDVTNLRNRGLAFAFTSSPAVITAFAGSKAAEGFYNNVSWQWGIGCWAIIFPCVALPLYYILNRALRKAEREGIITQEKSGRTLPQQVWYVVKEFDLPGVSLFACGLVLFLLPFTLAATAPNGWKTGYIIAMIVVGIVLLVLFVLHQTYVAPTPFLKSRFLLDRTVLGACLLDATYQISYYCYASYFSSFLMVVNNLTIAEAGYVSNTFSAVSFVFLFITGYIIRVTGRFKWILWFCLPMYVFALGLMIHFRQPNGYIGYIVMCEILFSVSGAIFILCVQLAVLATVDHQYVASVLAFLFVSGTIGGAIGSAVSGAIWTNTFKKALGWYLPESARPDLQTIYESLPAQLAYKVGTPERLAIQQAYGYAQTRMLAAGCSVMVLGFIAVAMIRDINVKKMSQTKGNVL
ncbi:hypothetical protein ACLOAV_004249 [Pseudogymnoascus australis]